MIAYIDSFLTMWFFLKNDVKFPYIYANICKNTDLVFLGNNTVLFPKKIANYIIRDFIIVCNNLIWFIYHLYHRYEVIRNKISHHYIMLKNEYQLLLSAESYSIHLRFLHFIFSEYFFVQIRVLIFQNKKIISLS